MPRPTLRLHFENAAGRVLELPRGRHDGHVEIEHCPGPRRFSDLQTLLGQAKQLLALRGWHKMLGDQRHAEPFTPEEQHWVTTHWLNLTHGRSRVLFGAVVLPPAVYAQLSREAAAAQGQASAMTYRLFDDPAPARAWLAQL
jgi:hypothetical protein